MNQQAYDILRCANSHWKNNPPEQEHIAEDLLRKAVQMLRKDMQLSPTGRYYTSLEYLPQLAHISVNLQRGKYCYVCRLLSDYLQNWDGDEYAVQAALQLFEKI